MPKLTIHIEHREPGYTVSQMRRELARALSSLPGGQEISFVFNAALPKYIVVPASPTPLAIIHHERDFPKGD